MKYRDFGATGLSVSEIGVGCSRIGGVLSAGASRKQELALLQAAADAGITFFDTADFYSQGQSEVLVGQALRRRRSEVVIASKGGYVVSSHRRLLSRIKPLVKPIVHRLGIKKAGTGGHGAGRIAQDFSPDYLSAAVEASLRRLGTDYIDIYQLHSPPASVVEAGEYCAVLETLQAQGKLRHFGIAVEEPEDAVSFERHPAIASLQVPFNLLYQQASHVVFPRAAARGLGVIARSCYAAGLFKEGLDDATLRASTSDADGIIALRRKADELGRTLLEAALQFSLATEAVSVTILGMRSSEHLRGNLRLSSAPPLTPPEMDLLTGRAAPH